MGEDERIYPVFWLWLGGGLRETDIRSVWNKTHQKLCFSCMDGLHPKIGYGILKIDRDFCRIMTILRAAQHRKIRRDDGGTEVEYEGAGGEHG